jgi:hypothetical protein
MMCITQYHPRCRVNQITFHPSYLILQRLSKQISFVIYTRIHVAHINATDEVAKIVKLEHSSDFNTK